MSSLDKGGKSVVDWEIEKVLAHFEVDPSQGLSEKEAQKRQQQVGRNRLAEGKKRSSLRLFLEQFNDFMVWVLIVATLISGLLGEYTDAVAIIAIVILNAILGFVQEVRAEKSLAALKKLSAPTAKVLRNGSWIRVDAEELVPGDVVSLESGDRIPADLRLIQAENLYLEESALTGESVPVAKNAQRVLNQKLSIGDQKNMAFMGTMVVRGSGQGIVVRTGMNTEMGKIAHLIENTESTKTPLQHRLEQLGKVLIVVSLLLTALVVITGILHGHPVYKMFLAGVSLAVAAIPEGLPAIVTIALALGVQRMIKRNAIVRRLPSVETLGCATVICSDKTGTLTQNKMTVTHLWLEGQLLEVTGRGDELKGKFVHQHQTISPQRSSGLRKLLEIAVLCNNASMEQAQTAKGFLKRKTNVWKMDGDPTEVALLVAGAKGGFTKTQLQQRWKRMKEYPFDSERKRMSVVVQEENGKRYLMVKGAPEVILPRCTYITKQGRLARMTAAERQELLQVNAQLAAKALRILAFAYRELPKDLDLKESTLEKEWIFVGLAGMIDPPRKEVKESIRKCRKAGIRTVMITGDHQATAKAIAKEIGLLRPNGSIIHGEALDQMKEDELLQKVDEIDVYARVSPEHKLKIVKALRKRGHIVAMTGDGVNDAPAIKAADIGIAMGMTGTDVSKEASSLVLADDHFATIVSAIEEGRNIYDNIRKFISYLLASNVGEILVMFLAMLMGLPLPLVPIQILWVNLVTDGLPAMALGVDPSEEDTMNRPPRNSRESIFARGVGWKIVSRGLLIGFWSLVAFFVTYQEAPDHLELAQTVAFATLVFAQLIYVFDCRSAGSIFNRNPFSNIPLILAVISSVVLLLVVIYHPTLQPVFHTVPLGLREWILVCVTSTLPVIIAGLFDQLKALKRIVYG